jgi:hypothetical protein
VLLVRQADVEARVVELHHLIHRGCRSVMEVGARAARPRRTGPFTLLMSAHLPVINARPGSVVWSNPQKDWSIS